VNLLISLGSTYSMEDLPSSEGIALTFGTRMVALMHRDDIDRLGLAAGWRACWVR
jgi:hypothetical protein